MISLLTLQLLWLAVYTKKDPKNAVFDGILQFVAHHNKMSAATQNTLIHVINHLAPGHPRKPMWMIKSQTDLWTRA
jgi:hypothetical protein